MLLLFAGWLQTHNTRNSPSEGMIRSFPRKGKKQFGPLSWQIRGVPAILIWGLPGFCFGDEWVGRQVVTLAVS